MTFEKTHRKGTALNRWHIPACLEREVRERDKACVYCGVSFASEGPVAARVSWEHIVNDANIVTRENIALCCRGCNASKGAHALDVWLDSPYCKRRGITVRTVADVVKTAILRRPYAGKSSGPANENQGPCSDGRNRQTG